MSRAIRSYAPTRAPNLTLAAALRECRSNAARPVPDAGPDACTLVVAQVDCHFRHVRVTARTRSGVRKMASHDQWLADLSGADLLSLIPSCALEHLDNPDRAAEAVLADYTAGLEGRRRLKTERGEEKDLTFAARSWPRLKKEFYSLLCTDDAAYADVRSKLVSSGKTVTILLVAIVAQSLGDKLGLVCGPTVCLVAILLYSALRLGQRTLCGMLAAECGQ